MSVIEKANRNRGADAGKRSLPRLLSGNGLRGLSGRSQPGLRGSRDAAFLDDQILRVATREPKAGVPRQPQRKSIVKTTFAQRPAFTAASHRLRQSAPTSVTPRWLALSILRCHVAP